MWLSMLAVPRIRYRSLFVFMASGAGYYSYCVGGSCVRVFQLPSGWFVHDVVRSGRLWFSGLPF